MNPHAHLLAIATATLIAAGDCLGQSPAGRVHLRLDTAEAQRVLDILESEQRGESVADTAWQQLLATPGYARLKAREAAMHRPFTDSTFVAFVRSDSLIARAPALRRTLTRWESADLQAAARRALGYLPASATLEATVFVVIKPRTNSFVWDLDSDPAIFLYLDPDVTPARFANTVAHELHHIGLSGVLIRADSARAVWPERSRLVATWIGAFGEGFAMLAAAGGSRIHPHAESPDSIRARWDRDVTHFNADLKTLDGFFHDILSGRLATADTVQAVAASYYGTQGPWYTVGWKMAVTIENRFGRSELIRCMSDPRRLLTRYNEAAVDHTRASGDSLARWSPEIPAALHPSGSGALRSSARGG